VGEPAPIGAPCGTTVAVRDLFFNTPARLKYLRTVSTENRRIVDIVGSLALSHPEIGFTLKVDGRGALTTPRGGSIEEAAAVVLGLDVAREMIPLKGYSRGVSVEGLISLPHLAKGKRRDKQYVSVNRRPVTSTTVWSAVDRAYDRTVPAGIRPPVVLSIEIDPSMVDVNVHPAKSEVRFASSSDVYSALHGAVASVLRSADAVPGLEEVGPADGWSSPGSRSGRRLLLRYRQGGRPARIRRAMNDRHGSRKRAPCGKRGRLRGWFWGNPGSQAKGLKSLVSSTAPIF